MFQLLLPYRFILIACDGLWKAFSVEDAARFIINVLEVVNVSGEIAMGSIIV